MEIIRLLWLNGVLLAPSEVFTEDPDHRDKLVTRIFLPELLGDGGYRLMVGACTTTFALSNPGTLNQK